MPVPAGSPAGPAGDTMEVEGPSTTFAPPATAPHDKPNDPSAPVVLVLDTPTLRSMTELLLRICWDASRLMITLAPPSAPMAPASVSCGSQQLGEGGGMAGGSTTNTTTTTATSTSGAAAHSGACSSSSGGGSGIAWLQDAVVGVVREGMGLLGKLLIHHPPLYGVLFSEPRAGQCVGEGEGLYA
ncbi:hypothetical protein DUNSADRAFT_8394 [Dunaliella salina]|uniref:Uncharacterized protein n=1 Tax=Dunaliella salina TaxID=3046 RepID=A0ABQ7GJN3_DUNSA|nr:hypothetical protein DUNSADRAFT_8394 [Dunaliella salina]|eukprot:KAF5834810.1 hypothetical protein DUNSADRAFT_8394 [Dunaliella salina]